MKKKKNQKIKKKNYKRHQKLKMYMFCFCNCSFHYAFEYHTNSLKPLYNFSLHFGNDSNDIFEHFLSKGTSTLNTWVAQEYMVLCPTAPYSDEIEGGSNRCGTEIDQAVLHLPSYKSLPSFHSQKKQVMVQKILYLSSCSRALIIKQVIIISINVYKRSSVTLNLFKLLGNSEIFYW